MIGTVKSYDRRRGLGEVTIERNEQVILVYVAELERAGLVTLAPGDRMSFDVKADRMIGRFAINLRLLA